MNKELRAGKVKCRRCKTAFHRNRGEDFRICSFCREHCARCNVLLTLENISKVGATRNQYFCAFCVAENVRNTRDKTKQKDYDLIRNYGITYNEYEQLLKSQDGKCWICGRTAGTVRLSVDHKHERGERRRSSFLIRARVRGILCWHCNNALAKFGDSPALLRRAADYLEEIPAQKVLDQGDDSAVHS